MTGKRVGDFEIIDVYDLKQEEFDRFSDEHDDFEYWQEGETIYSAEDYHDLVFGDLLPGQEFAAFKYFGTDENIVIPDAATQLGSSLFEGNEKVKSVTIPDSVKIIGDNAFKNCTALEKVKFGKGVTEISEFAFCGCTALKEIEIPSGVTVIRNGAFEGCAALTQVAISDGVERVGEYAFCNCTSLSAVKLGNGLKCIYSGAFKGCTALKNITLPQSLTSVDLYAFSESGIEELYLPKNVSDMRRCSYLNSRNLKKVEVDPENPHLMSKDNCIIRKSSGILLAAVGDFKLPVDGSLKKIDCWVFNGNRNVTELDIPEGVTHIYSSAFRCCANLRRLSLPSTLEVIGEDCFEGTSALEEIVIPAGVKEVESGAFYCSGIKRLVVKRGVEILGFNAFSECKRLAEAYIPSSVYKIDCGLFSGELFGGCNKKLCVYMEKRKNGGHEYLARFLGDVKVEFIDKAEICD
ncbi:MAG: leucine-rich repeat domain-containing protein [Clostridiales bacterium]|nr:leucine-rich repeat domain-containing protein [Clostridiales bacterium]